jgi:HD-like signal output (HDOD) protein
MATDHQRLGGFDFDGFWRHAVRVATACKKIISNDLEGERIVPDDCYTAGLLHDLGQVAMNDVDALSYRELLSASRDDEARMVKLERELYGLDHGAYGAMILAFWKLPERITQAIGAHTLSDPPLREKRLPRLLRMIDKIDGVIGSDAEAVQEYTDHRLLEELQVTPELFDIICSEMLDAKATAAH